MDIKFQEDYKTNFFKPTYDVNNLDETLIKEAKYHEEKALQLRQEAGLITYIYVLSTHPIIIKKLAQKGRLLHYKEFDTTAKSTSTRKYGVIAEIKNLTIDQFEEEVNIFNLLSYHKQPYVRIAVIVQKEETIAMVTGYSEKNR